jgi:hypothetical protein
MLHSFCSLRAHVVAPAEVELRAAWRGGAGYQGKDVVVENLRQLCVFDVANATGAPWLWWDYASQFAAHCKMDDVRYNGECADPIIVGLGIDLGKVQRCMGMVRTPLAAPV